MQARSSSWPLFSANNHHGGTESHDTLGKEALLGSKIPRFPFVCSPYASTSRNVKSGAQWPIWSSLLAGSIQTDINSSSLRTLHRIPRDYPPGGGGGTEEGGHCHFSNSGPPRITLRACHLPPRKRTKRIPMVHISTHFILLRVRLCQSRRRVASMTLKHAVTCSSLRLHVTAWAFHVADCCVLNDGNLETVERLSRVGIGPPKPAECSVHKTYLVCTYVASPGLEDRTPQHIISAP